MMQIAALYDGVLTWNKEEREYEIYYIIIIELQEFMRCRAIANVLSFGAMRIKIFLKRYSSLRMRDIFSRVWNACRKTEHEKTYTVK